MTNKLRSRKMRNKKQNVRIITKENLGVIIFAQLAYNFLVSV